MTHLLVGLGLKVSLNLAIDSWLVVECIVLPQVLHLETEDDSVILGCFELLLALMTLSCWDVS